MKNLKGHSIVFLVSSAVVKIYQLFFSPDHGIFCSIFGFSRCRFYPSCSEYTLRATRQYGLLRGGVLSLGRIARCVPWNNGGYDPVENKT